jgi:hypothetical protein
MISSVTKRRTRISRMQVKTAAAIGLGGYDIRPCIHDCNPLDRLLDRDR